MSKTKPTLNQLLEDIAVHDREGCSSPDMTGWFGVSTPDAGGFVAYFRDEEAALGFRLHLINAVLNNVKVAMKAKS